jgi:hypothetical protein
MPEQAGVYSIHALERFRSALLIYQEKAATSLHEITYEVARTRNWVHSERLPFWKSEIRRIQRNLEDAQQHLFSAEISDFRDNPSAEQRLVRRLRDSKRDAEEKLRITERWALEYDTSVDPLVKAVERLRSLVEGLSHAVFSLSEMIKSLESYAELSRPQPSQSSPADPLEQGRGEDKPDVP